MIFKRYQRVIGNIILAVMIFASLAPTVSHALTHFTGNPTFTQQICSSNGDKLVIQVKTTMGKQLQTELPRVANSSVVDDFSKHFAHCPFCTHSAVDAVIPEPSQLILAKLEADAHQLALLPIISPASPRNLLPASQAPPKSTNN